MGKRPASSKATRGVSKARRPINSSSSNPRTTKFRSQYNNLAVIAKGGPSKKAQNKEAIKRLAKDAVERKKLLDGIDSINMLGENNKDKEVRKHESDEASDITCGTKLTTASFASVWSNCTNATLNEFFQVWNPNLETHRDALAVIAGLSRLTSDSSSSQSDMEYARIIFKILSSPETPVNVTTGALLALTFIMRKLPAADINENFDSFYSTLKSLMELHHTSRRKTLVKCLMRCFACLTKAHPLGKDAIEGSLRKKINLAIRQHKVQNKISL